MKILVRTALFPEIESIQKTIKEIQIEIRKTRSAIMELIELEDGLQGKTGEAIRTFYDTVHLPFLTQFEKTLTNYSESMLETKNNFLSYDSNKAVFIHEGLLKNEVIRGLDEALHTTEGLVSEANTIMGSVSDIISLSPLSMDEFAEYIMKGKRYIHEVVIQNLYDLDKSRKSALIDIHTNLKTIYTYLKSVDISFKDKRTIENFQPISTFMLPGFASFQKKNYISNQTLACLYTKPDNYFVRNFKRGMETSAGILLGIKDYGADLVQGIYLLTRLKNEPHVVAKEMAPSIALIARDPKTVWSNIKQEIKDSFSDNMINGTDRSRARYSTYVLLSVADVFIGTHGAGAATKGAANLSKINKIPSRSLNHSFQQTKQWQPLLENKQFTGMNVLNRNKLQEDFLLSSKLMTKEMNFHKTDYLVPYSSESVKDLLHKARQIEESRVVGKGIDNTAHNAAQYQKLKEQLALDEIQSVINTTKHGAERLIERGFTPKDISDLKLRPDIIKTQSDGAQVFIKQVNGKYNVIVEGDNGVITSLKNISENSLNRLSGNYR